jgi:hypothetical protein
MQGYRQALEELSKHDPSLAKEFIAVSHQLEHNSVSNDTDIGLLFFFLDHHFITRP